ncbi:hypothetical protein VE02_04230 [Pseudogymnoascus sp. 03VT05]|nr:hypothetical protein VE02_04230 [Pseudogymnoascus sp. 03VT05]
MEAAPLSQAYDHAQAASIATHASDHPTAITAHSAAASSFAAAASTTTSPEALRTLALLATHHSTLSAILVAPNPPPTLTDADLSTGLEPPISTSAAVAELRAKSSSDTPPTAGGQPSSSRRTPASTSLQPPRRMPPRELSSSIASNLASARGIRTAHPLSPGLTTTNAPGAISARRRTHDTTTPTPSSGPSWLPPVSHDQIARTDAVPSRAGKTTPAEITLPASDTDEGFTRFYSTFEGLLSKLSAPLAFAGLPLIAEESTQPAKPPSRPSTSASANPDLSRYISRAALRASASKTGAADSFYVVPTTGGTASYASILSFAEKEKRRLADQRPASSFEDDDFVDAREHPSPPSPTKSRSFAAAAVPSSRSGKSAKEGDREREELGIENKSLKACVDMLSKRLHAFEAAAQSSTIALHESMRFLKPVSSGAGAATPVVPLEQPRKQKEGERDAPTSNDARILTARAEGLEARLVAVEAQLADEKRARRVAEAENEKLRGVVGRYRERWERLKEGAKSRRDGVKDGKDGKEGGKDGGGGKEGGGGEGRQPVDGGRFVAG